MVVGQKKYHMSNVCTFKIDKSLNEKLSHLLYIQIFVQLLDNFLFYIHIIFLLFFFLFFLYCFLSIKIEKMKIIKNIVSNGCSNIIAQNIQYDIIFQDRKI